MGRTRLTSLDGSFLRVETPTAHMHVAWKGRFRPPPDDRPVTVRALRSAVAGRLERAPRFRQRLAFPPGGLAEPVWVDDERFDLGWHIVALSGPDEVLPRRRFDELCDLVLSEPLDRERALWRIFLAPQVEGGGPGLVMKAHHAMVDGTSAVELALLLLDLGPDEAVPAAIPQWAPQPVPGGSRLALEALADGGVESFRRAAGIARMAARPGSSVRLAGTLRRAALSVGEDLLRPAGPSYLNVPIGPRRTLVHHSSALPPLLEVKRRFGCTLNDVALAAVAGALRGLALAAGERPQPLKVMVPVNRRAGDDAAALGNRISFVFIDLPVHATRAADRVAAVHAATSAFKRERRAEGGEAVLGALGLLPDPLKGRAAKLAASPRTYNLTVSNVPGPRFPVFLLGCELTEAVPVIPLADEHALSIGIFTFGDRIAFGGYADPTALPAVRELPGALNQSVLELTRHAKPHLAAVA